MDDLYQKQAETIKLLTEIITTNSKKEYIKSLKHICIAVIISFTVLICFFYYLYFTTDYSSSIQAKNTTEHTENFNYTEFKKSIEENIAIERECNNVGVD